MCDLEEEEVRESMSPICDDEDFEMEDEMEISDSVSCNRRKTFFREGNRSLQSLFMNAARKKIANLVVVHNLPFTFVEFTGFRDLMQSACTSSQAFDINVVREKMAKMVIMHDLPIPFAQSPWFKDLIQFFQPLLSANPITTAMVEEDILKLYEVENPKIMRLLQSNESKLAISVDVLTADEENAYMAVTARFVDESWVLQSRIMRLIHVQYPYTAETLYGELIKFLMDWKVDRKLSAVTIDSCSTNSAMMSMLIERDSFVRKGMGGKFFPIRCCALILRGIIMDEMKAVKHVIQKIRKSVYFWRSTSERRKDFKHCAHVLGVEYSKKLVSDFEPQWSSTYEMLGTALEYKDVFIRLTEWDEQYEKNQSLPTDSEWEKAKELCEHLEVFYRLIEMLSGTKHLTANAFIIICEIRLSIHRWLKSSNDEIRSMATNMMAKFDTYWEAVYGVLAVGIVLDPRLKMQYIEFFFSELYGDEAEDHVKRVHNFCSDLEKEYQSNAASGLGLVKKCGDSCIDHSNAVKKIGMGSYTKEFKLFLAQKTCNKPVISELDGYLKEYLLDMDMEFDVLDWWKKKKDTYPILSTIAKDIFAIPLFTIACETIFSKGRKLLSPHRRRLQPNTLNAIMCTQDWFWNGYIPKSQLATDYSDDGDDSDFDDKDDDE